MDQLNPTSSIRRSNNFKSNRRKNRRRKSQNCHSQEPQIFYSPQNSNLQYNISQPYRRKPCLTHSINPSHYFKNFLIKLSLYSFLCYLIVENYEEEKTVINVIPIIRKVYASESQQAAGDQTVDEEPEDQDCGKPHINTETIDQSCTDVGSRAEIKSALEHVLGPTYGEGFVQVLGKYCTFERSCTINRPKLSKILPSMTFVYVQILVKTTVQFTSTSPSK